MKSYRLVQSFVCAGSVLLALVCGSFCGALAAAESDDAWIGKIRTDHPRLFFNAETWPAVKQRALTVCKEHYAAVKKHADKAPKLAFWSVIERPAPRPGTTTEVRDWGDVLMSAAFVYRVEPTPERLQQIRKWLQASLDFYHACYAQGKSVNWYARTRIGWLAALDWVWNDLAPEERQRLGKSMIAHVNDVLHKPNILRRNGSGHTTGYYGGNNTAFFAGIVFHREGFGDAKAVEFLKYGHRIYMKLLPHRASSCGDDGGAASPTIGYSFAAYPNAEWKLLYAWRSAMGQDLAPQWPYIGMIGNYVLWNMLPHELEYGYGDTPHTTNTFTRWWIYTHMSNTMHFYAESRPDLAALAAYVRTKARKYFHTSVYSVYPFLMTDLEKAPPPLDPGKLPPARHFEEMGQIFMRSGDGPDDTYALFAAGGMSPQHRHYDATHFTIYKRGFLALDTGTRKGNSDNLQNYFAQTVAHNCVLIKMPGEPPSRYWNGKVFGQAGGQNKQVGSKVIAFETGPDFTYVAGDATPVYSDKKCALMVRQFVFIPPDHFVVFDRVTSTKAEFRKRWLLHHALEPTLTDKTWRSDQAKGRLFCRTLLPADAQLEKVGGPGKEFMADGVNYPITAGPSERTAKSGLRRSKLKYKQPPELMGRWRMEVSPGAPRTDDIFLHLIQVGDQTLERMCDAQVQTTGDAATATFAAGQRAVTLRFAAKGDVAGHVRIAQGDKVIVERDLRSDVMPQVGLASLETKQ